jgi:hypothetical protein
MYFCLGLLFMPFFLLAGGMALLGAGAAQGQDKIAGGIGGAMMIGLAILFPVIYGVMGFIAGMISALLYNLMAKWVGGVEMEFVPKQPSTAMPVPPLAAGASQG